jgi:signal transduction histidine kinase
MAFRSFLSGSWFRRFEVGHAALLVALVTLMSMLVGDAVVVALVDRRLSRLAAGSHDLRSWFATCQTSPAACPPRWTGNIRADAFDEASLSPCVPGASLDRSLADRLLEGEPAPGRIGWFWGWGSAILTRVPGARRCGLVQLRRESMPDQDIANIGLLTVAAGLAACLAVLLMFLTSLRPMLARLRRLRVAAHTVGSVDDYRSASDPYPDDAGRISEALDAADARIRRDADLLQRRGEVLARHLEEVSHDVRTPLSALLLALETALGERDPEACQRYIGSAMADASYLAALLENLQVAARMESGIEPCALGVPDADLGSIVDTMELRLGPLARNRRVELATSRPDTVVAVRADGLLLERAIGNLIHNAIVHGRAGGHVAVLLEPEVEGHFLLSITDDGPGMEAAQLSSLNQCGPPPERPHGRRRLGLVIACSVLRGIGWEVRFRPGDPTGLRVEVRGAWHLAKDHAKDHAKGTDPRSEEGEDT